MSSYFNIPGLNFPSQSFGDSYKSLYPALEGDLAYIQELEDKEKEKDKKFNEWNSKFEEHLSKGDGNAAVDDIAQAYKEGLLTKEEAIEAANGLQQVITEEGGGKISDGQRKKLQEALGLDYDPISAT